ncbi:retinol dehydrogenase 11-like [Danaus plexippus]|uniref:retinol dehydrogenase 11-like n=1 Tax=Danaus plexippus TaxID=13037 RepID=UPI002AAF1841|nr:retinol dehydrogenase 11-like [Danaus plexippus]
MLYYIAYILLTILLLAVKVVVGFFLFVFLCFAIARLWFEPIKGVCRAKTKLHGKVALITGGNSGIGLETAKDLAQRGARVVIASRNDKKSAEAVEEIKRITGNEKVEYRHLNLRDMDSVREFAKKFNEEFDRLDILVNNAGIGAAKNALTADNIDILMAINYVGPFLLTHLLLDKIKATKTSRIVIVSSYLHFHANFELDDLTRVTTKNTLIKYCNAKLCDVLWTKELSRRLPAGVTVNVLHPGLVKTNIFDTLHKCLKNPLYVIIDLLFKTAKEGAQTVIYLCVDPAVENMTGGYYMDCKKIPSSKLSEDEDLAKALWDKTLELVCVKPVI